VTQREDSSKRVPHALIGTQLGPYEILACSVPAGWATSTEPETVASIVRSDQDRTRSIHLEIRPRGPRGSCAEPSQCVQLARHWPV